MTSKFLAAALLMMTGQLAGAQPPASMLDGRRAHVVEIDNITPLSVDTQGAGMYKVVATLTYDDGQKARCAYVMKASLEKAAAERQIKITPPPGTTECVSLK